MKSIAIGIVVFFSALLSAHEAMSDRGSIRMVPRDKPIPYSTIAGHRTFECSEWNENPGKVDLRIGHRVVTGIVQNTYFFGLAETAQCFVLDYTGIYYFHSKSPGRSIGSNEAAEVDLEVLENLMDFCEEQFRQSCSEGFEVVESKPLQIVERISERYLVDSAKTRPDFMRNSGQR